MGPSSGIFDVNNGQPANEPGLWSSRVHSWANDLCLLDLDTSMGPSSSLIGLVDADNGPTASEPGL